MNEEKTISQIYEELITEMCDKFCHWPMVCTDEDELDEHCDKCSLNILF